VQIGRIQRKVDAIRNLLAYLAETEMDRRYDLQAQEIFDWTPLYLFVDEVPWLVEVYPEITDYLRAILQRGRAIDVRLTTNAQSFLVGNTGLGSGARDNFGTAHFLGGNAKSAAAMLGMGERELKQLVAEVQAETNQELGKGLELVRNLERVPKAEPARVPYGTNDFQYYLLGRHDDWQLPEFRGQRRTQQEVEGTVVLDEMEALAPNPLRVHRASGASHGKSEETTITDVRGAHFYEKNTEVAEESYAPSNVRPFTIVSAQQPVEPSGVAPDERPKEYRFSEAEIGQFLAAYRASGNVDKALAAMGKGKRYRDHAREILAAHNERQA
jgi:hypothetical protein